MRCIKNVCLISQKQYLVLFRFVMYYTMTQNTFTCLTLPFTKKKFKSFAKQKLSDRQQQCLLRGVFRPFSIRSRDPSLYPPPPITQYINPVEIPEQREYVCLRVDEMTV